MDQTNTGNTNEKIDKQAVNTMLKNKMGARKGGMKVKKAGLGLMMLAGKKNRRKLGKTNEDAK